MEVVFDDSMIDVQHQLETTSCNEEIHIPSHSNDSNQKKIQRAYAEKHSAVWTSSATSTLLKLYESKLEMLVTPKRKTRIWWAISECLQEHDINVSPDQVRWKINALTRKYKRCIDTGLHEKFKYFKEMEQIYSKYNIDNYGCTISEILDRKNEAHKYVNNKNHSERSESKAIIELRKIRLANRMESDRSQTKINLEKQWLEYLNRKERVKNKRDEIIDRNLKLKEQELELRKRELELEQSLGIKIIQLIEKDINEIVVLEKEKCELLNQLICFYAICIIYFYLPRVKWF